MYLLHENGARSESTTSGSDSDDGVPGDRTEDEHDYDARINHFEDSQ